MKYSGLTLDVDEKFKQIAMTSFMGIFLLKPLVVGK